MRWKTNWNSNEFPKHDAEPGGGISVTIPDQTMTVSEMLQRHRRGLSIPDGKVPIYNMDPQTGEPYDLPDLTGLDLAELQMLREEAKAKVEHIKDELNRHEQRMQHERAQQAKQQKEAQREAVQSSNNKQTPKQSRSDQPGASHPGALEGLDPDSGG